MFVTVVVGAAVLVFLGTFVVERRRRARLRRLAEQGSLSKTVIDTRGFEGSIGAEGHFRTGASDGFSGT
jgi:hypothetical protein